MELTVNKSMVNNVSLKSVAMEIRCKEVFRMGNVVLYKDEKGKIYGRIIR